MGLKYRIALNTRAMDDAKRAEVLAGIQKTAPQSPLATNTSIAASLAALGTKGAALATSVAAVASNTSVLKASMTQRDGSRDTFDLELIALKTLTENNATSASDVTSMGFVLLEEQPSPEGPPVPPLSLLVKYARKRGDATVSVAAKGYQGSFAAQVSPDPIGNWTSLPGTGKARKLTGYASGAKVWVQFASVRHGLQSAWCTPVLLTFP